MSSAFFRNVDTPPPRPRGLAEVATVFDSHPARTPPAPGAPRPPVALPFALLDELVGSGHLTEAQMLDIAGRQLGRERVSLDRLPPDPDLSGLLPPAACARHAILPWRRDGNGLVFVTARPATAADPDRLLPPRLRPARAVLAPRAEVEARIAALHRAALTGRMAARPEAADSFRGYTPSRQLIAAILLGTLATLIGMTFAPALVFLALIAFATLSLTIALGFKCTAVTASLLDRTRRRAPPPVPLTELPVISILVPLYRERHIAETLVRRLRGLDYPRGRLEVLLVLEAKDRLTAEVLRRTDLPPWMRILTVPDGHPRTKPRAMNYALDFCRGEIIGIYDAEDAPATDQLLTVAARFAAAPANLACLQGALDFYNPRASWISRCFAIEYNTWFRLILPGMARLGLGVPLGGTTLFIRRAALEAVGAWDAHNVTEDADLGFRLARYGWRTEVIPTTTGGEATARPIPWIRQRSRWLKGYMVTYLVQMRRPRALWRALGPRAFLGMQAHFVTALSQYLLGPLLWSFWLLMPGLSHPAAAMLAPGLITAVSMIFLAAILVEAAIALIATRSPAHRHLRIWIPALFIYYGLAWIAAYKALLELLVAPFYWDKTPHGEDPATAPGDE